MAHTNQHAGGHIPMKRDILMLTLIALAVRVLTALPLRVPGYMDAYYYYVAAERIAGGYGLTEPFLWNYLAEPLRLPAPAFQYWMPLTSLIAVPFLVLFGPSFRAAQIPFILLSSLLPALGYCLSMELAPGRRKAWVSGFLLIFTPFYMKFWPTTDSFALYAVLGCGAMLSLLRATRTGRPAWFFLAGLCAGLGHLTRADAPLLLVAFALLLVWPGEEIDERMRPLSRRAAGLLLAGAAYLLVIAPWLCYNRAQTGRVWNSAGTQTIFLRTYDDLYAYGRTFDLASYLSWGWQDILESKLWAAGQNALTAIGVFLSFYLAPLAGWEMWVRRRMGLSRLTFWYLALLYGVMTLVFTFPGPRGTLLHSGAALLPALMVFAAHGLERAVRSAARRRPSWDIGQAQRVFSVGAVALAGLFSALLYAQALWDAGDPGKMWNTQHAHYQEVEAVIRQSAPADAPVLVVNPPAYYYFARRPALAIPNEPAPVVADVCRRFGASHLILEPDHPHPLDGLYQSKAEVKLFPLEDVLQGPDGEVQIYRCPTDLR